MYLDSVFRSAVRWGAIGTAIVLGAGCAGLERTSESGRTGGNPEAVIVSESEEFELGYRVENMQGQRKRGQVFDDGDRTFFAWPRDSRIESLQTAEGQPVNVEKVGAYYIADRVEGMWFLEDSSGNTRCVRDAQLSRNACSDTVDASQARGAPGQEELKKRREELENRLRALEQMNGEEYGTEEHTDEGRE